MKSKVKELISQNRLKEVIQVLREAITSYLSKKKDTYLNELHNELIIYSSNFNYLQDSINLGILDEEKKAIARGKILNGLLNLVDKLPDKFDTSIQPNEIVISDSYQSDDLLCHAIRTGDIELAKKIILSPVNKLAINWEKAMLLAISQAYKDLAEVISDKVVNINAVREKDNKSLLLLAIDRGMFDLAKKLLERGADPEIKDIYGWQPVTVALVKADTWFKDFIVEVCKTKDIYIPTKDNIVNSVGTKLKSFHFGTESVNSVAEKSIIIGNPEINNAQTNPNNEFNRIAIEFSITFNMPQDLFIENVSIRIKSNYLNGEQMAINNFSINRALNSKKDDKFEIELYKLETNEVIIEFYPDSKNRIKGLYNCNFTINKFPDKQSECNISVNAILFPEQKSSYKFATQATFKIEN